MNGYWVGKTLGKVQIETLIARGGLAEVYLGTHKTLQRKVAVKILRNPSDEHPDDLERFHLEARVVASLRHPNIVHVYDFDMVDNDPYLIMEYVEGPSLSKYLHYLHKNGKKLGLPHVARLLGSIASALQYAHNNNIVHRDVKPGNILVTSPSKKIILDKPFPEDFVPVLTDFGLIRFLDSARQTTTGVTAGTPAYMSPEQAQGVVTDGQTDVYSLGIVLYELLAGRIPFDGETTVSILLKHVNEPPAPIPGLSPFMQDVLNRALAKKREDRFPSPAEFAKSFYAAFEINPATIEMDALVPATPPALHTDNLSKADQPKRSVWMRIAIAGISALVIGAYFFLNKLPSSASIINAETTPRPTSSPVFTSTNIITPLPVDLETSLVLHFRDNNAIADHAFLEANRVPAPPRGSNYEVWLFNSRERISLGILSLDANGKGELIFIDGQGENLVAKYDQAKITLEPVEDTNPAPTNSVAFSFALPSEGTQNIRFLLSSYPGVPEKTALIQGINDDIKKISELAAKMDSAYTNGNESSARESAEAILNLIVGEQSSDYIDWDQNGFIADDSNGYGLEHNGSNLGYLETVFTEADKAVKSSKAASQTILIYGENLKTCVQNLTSWTPQLQELIVAILEAPSGTDLKEQIVDVNILAAQMVNGVDLDGNGKIEATQGECGINSAYVFAYAMADMPLESTGLVVSVKTSTPSEGEALDVPSGAGGSGGAGVQASPTQPLPPGQTKTKKPQPTK